ncbi:hypothetical protein [Lentzea sp. NBRC 102530]|uniref:hypothetical protein n=1 Tax=Lentzea sp. NBRC 102530 TaxID=3032201 RepID=UPI0024A0E12D|nr:hypothetical protein [Lentzea sp. NBRC 102530]GLY50905.1 hypothetical protein Lesp01_45610 [Lentzea sp. NBRC 102530]
MTEPWTHDGSPVSDVVALLRARIDAGHLETWLTSASGRSLTFVTNAERAMLMLLDGEGDAGEHATTPGVEGASDGFVLSNGQNDEYPDADTVALPKALTIAEHVVRTGTWPADAHHVSDR